MANRIGDREEPCETPYFIRRVLDRAGDSLTEKWRSVRKLVIQVSTVLSRSIDLSCFMRIPSLRFLCREDDRSLKSEVSVVSVLWCFLNPFCRGPRMLL